MEEKRPLRKIEVFDHVLKQTEDILDKAQLFLSSLSDRCSDTAYLITEKDGEDDSDRNHVAFLYELHHSLYFVRSTLGSQKDFLEKIRRESETA